MADSLKKLKAAGDQDRLLLNREEKKLKIIGRSLKLAFRKAYNVLLIIQA